MNLANIAAGLMFTTGISSYTIMQLQDTLIAVNEIEVEPLENVTEKTSIRKAIHIVNRNNIKRKKLILKIDSVLKENLKPQQTSQGN